MTKSRITVSVSWQGSPVTDHAEKLERINSAFVGFVPHNQALGLDVTDFGPDMATMRLRYASHLVGNPDTGVLHGGAITSLVDAACGAAVFMRLASPMPIATLDLRIDYLRPADPGKDVYARAECYRLTRNVAFVRALAYTDSVDDPVASAAATFMISTPGLSVMQRASQGSRSGGAE